MNEQGDTEIERAVPTPSAVPSLTDSAPEIGGRIKVAIEDFQVEEIPAYEPSGQGPHIYLWVEKRDVDGRRLIEAVSQRFGAKKRDIGTAGTKDRRAITRQWLSLPAQATGGEVPKPMVIDDGIEVVKASRHKNKLRTGHLRGNRFSIRIRDTELQSQALASAVEEIAGAIETQGLPNYYGPQRFGDQGSTLAAGWKWATGGRAPSGRFLRRMAASALQSEVFNRVLARRLRDGTWRQVMAGDIFEKCDTGGRFWIDAQEREETQKRLDNGRISVTGPMPGSKGGLATKQAGALEREVLGELGVDADDLKAFGRQGRGTRRPLTVFIDDLHWELEADDSVSMRFDLPSGCYATVLLREFMG